MVLVSYKANIKHITKYSIQIIKLQNKAIYKKGDK